MEGMLLVLVPAPRGHASELLAGCSGAPGRALGGQSQRSLSSSAQDLAVFPTAGMMLTLERRHSKGCECSGELRGGTVAVDLLIKINVLADKDDSAPIAIRSQDPARERAAHSCFLSSWRPLVVQLEVWGRNEVLHRSPQRWSAPGHTCSAAGMLASLLSRCRGEGTV